MRNGFFALFYVSLISRRKESGREVSIKAIGVEKVL